MVFQVPFPTGTVRDNLALGGGQDGTREAWPEASWGELLTDVGLDASFLGRTTDRLSLGEMQRVSVARALACGPDALLLDEPTSALDGAAASRLLETLSSLHRSRGLTLVLVTHDLGEARGIATHALRLDAGRLVAAGAASEVPAMRMTRGVRSVGAPGVSSVSVAGLLVCGLLVLATIALSRRERLGLERDLMIGALRTLIQLLLVGYVLGAIFRLDRALVVVGVLAVMLAVAARTASRRVPPPLSGIFPITLLALTGSSIAVLVS
jgi:energy-coupling factor transporter ATP-binding protein EcfA2